MRIKSSIIIYFTISILVGCQFNINKQNDIDNLPVPKVSSNDKAIIPTMQTAPWSIEGYMTRHINSVNSIQSNLYDIIFIGDSIIQRFETVGIDNLKIINSKFTVYNLGFEGDKTENVLWRLHNGELPNNNHTKYFVILIGTNNSKFNNDAPESIASGIGHIITLIHKVSPDTKILLLSILPRGRDKFDICRKNNERVNSIIKKYNSHLNVIYIDLTEYFIDDYGNLISENYNSDYVHITPKGYSIIKNKIFEYL